MVVTGSESPIVVVLRWGGRERREERGGRGGKEGRGGREEGMKGGNEE